MGYFCVITDFLPKNMINIGIDGSEQKMGNKRRETSSQKEKKTDDDSKIKEAKNKILASLWIQTFAQILEATSVTDLFQLEEQKPGSEEIVIGIWIQAIGQLIETLGVSEQVFRGEDIFPFRAQRTSVTGDWIQSIGAAVEATGGERVLHYNLLKGRDGLIP